MHALRTTTTIHYHKNSPINRQTLAITIFYSASFALLTLVCGIIAGFLSCWSSVERPAQPGVQHSCALTPEHTHTQVDTTLSRRAKQHCAFHINNN